MKIKVSEATNAQLNYLVSLCEGWAPVTSVSWMTGLWLQRPDKRGTMQYEPPRNYVESWHHAGPIIDRKKISVQFDIDWVATMPDFDGHGAEYPYGPTPLVAAMRCHVASELGDTVDVPEELT